MLVLTLLLLTHAKGDPNPLCCFEGQATSGDNTCKGDPFCSPLCQPGSSFSCDANAGKPDIECQNCGCCPCCATGFACCKGGSVDSNLSFEDQEQVRLSSDKLSRSFRVEVTQYGESPDFQKGVCRPVCDNNCNGHGTCTPSPAGSCPANTCKCVSIGFDPTLSCATCKAIYFGAKCTECPAVSSSGKACSGHGTCDGAGTLSGTGACACDSGFAPEAGSGKECSTCDPTHWGTTCASCPNVVGNKVCSGHGTCDGSGTLGGTGTCTCDKGFDVEVDCEQCLPLHWGKVCSSCPGIVSPGTSGAAACSGHGTCDGDGSKQQGTGNCTCSYGWEGAACADLYCPKGCQHGTCKTLDGVNPMCDCDKGWHGATCR